MANPSQRQQYLEYVQSMEYDLQSIRQRISHDQASYDHLLKQCRKTIDESRELVRKAGEAVRGDAEPAAEEEASPPAMS